VYEADLFLGAGASLEVELRGGAAFDRLAVDGALTLGGVLQVTAGPGFTPALGDAFEVVTASEGLAGDFASQVLPDLPGGLSWQVSRGALDLRLEVIAASADFNADGVVDGSDFLQWQRNYGAQGEPAAAADANHDHQVDGADLAVWREQFPLGLTASTAAVPEPATVAVALCGLAGLTAMARRKR
jgi:hypothetical protein